MTPREFQAVVKGMRAAAKVRLREGQYLAYAQAAVSRMAMGRKQMPRFDEVFPDPDRQVKRMTAAEMVAALEQWAVVTRITTRAGEG